MKFTTILSSLIGIILTGIGFGYTLTIDPLLTSNQNNDFSLIFEMNSDSDLNKNEF